MKTQKELFDEHLLEFEDSRRALEFQCKERREAIKWIKKIKEFPKKEYQGCCLTDNCFFTCSECHDKASCITISNYNAMQGHDDFGPIIKWVQHYFNITNEELEQ